MLYDLYVADTVPLIYDLLNKFNPCSHSTVDLELCPDGVTIL